MAKAWDLSVSASDYFNSFGIDAGDYNFLLYLLTPVSKSATDRKPQDVIHNYMDEHFKKDYLSKVDENIDKYGFHITYVLGDEKGPSFCYSTGLYKNYKIPEIFMSGLPQNLSFDLVGDYAKKFKEKDVPLSRKIDSPTDYFKFPILFIEFENEDLKEYVYSSSRFYGEKEYRYLQLIYPDTNGLFPNDSGYNYNQEILGKI